MRFVLREGSGATARADVAMLTALGLPGGGIVRVGSTLVRVVPSDVGIPNELYLPPDAFGNGAVAPGSAVDVRRAVVPVATTVNIARDGQPVGHVPSSLLSLPVRAGESYTTPEGVVTVRHVQPGPSATIGPSTVATSTPAPTSPEATEAPTPGPPAMIAGLENELELLTGWLRLVTSRDPHPANGGVAGVIITGPPGSGKSELVHASADALGLSVTAVDLRTVTTAERLLASFERAVRAATPGTVLYVDHLDPLLEREAGTRHQAAAVTRWLLDTVADAARLAVVIASNRPSIGADLDAPELLPKTLEIAPPNHARRMALLAAALDGAPGVDLEILANATPGFSALDISTAVLDATARTGGRLTTETLLAAIRATPASLGTAQLGSIPSYGFDRVADLVEVKRALTESVIWQMREPERFTRMGIEPSRGILLYGPPGTGKTFVVRALAHESGAAFFAVKGAELLDKWVGESERGVREVFARARSVAPSIIFFDELDALAPVRGSSTNSVTDSVVAALLTELDGVAGRGDVFVIGATNRMDLIDPALLRPGRLETHLFLGLPGAEARASFFAMSTVPMTDDVDHDLLVDRTEGQSFADLDGLLREAALAAMRDDAHADQLTWAHLQTALET
jgi:transitional endoplasmic reticulum ATPase